ncbi:hypothetical protein MHB40_13570 [Lysinibacillus sp. FSL K6-0057]|uniref:hypothetical protein n=1 Tax=Lysinibacillus sp. FSL K6-0057 TaxID=2921411 RepID=UPI00315AD3F7
MKKFKVILPLLLAVILGGMFVTWKNQSYSATDILENANFDVENPTISLHRIDTDKEDIFSEIKISKETQKELLKSFQQATFKKTAIKTVDYDYRMTISLNTGYPMFIDSKNKTLVLLTTKESFEIVKGHDFFSMLEKAAEDSKKLVDVQHQMNEVVMQHRLPVTYVGGTTGHGEFHTSFYSNHSTEELGIRYDVKNRGTQQFSWKITHSEGKLWAQGTLAAGEEQTSILEKGSYTMPEGEYAISIITVDGAEGMFDFAIEVVE